MGVSTRIRIRLSIGSLSQTPIKFVLDYTDNAACPITYVGSLGPQKLAALHVALKVALDLLD